MYILKDKHEWLMLPRPLLVTTTSTMTKAESKMSLGPSSLLILKFVVQFVFRRMEWSYYRVSKSFISSYRE